MKIRFFIAVCIIISLTSILGIYANETNHLEELNNIIDMLEDEENYHQDIDVENYFNRSMFEEYEYYTVVKKTTGHFILKCYNDEFYSNDSKSFVNISGTIRLSQSLDYSSNSVVYTNSQVDYRRAQMMTDKVYLYDILEEKDINHSISNDVMTLAHNRLDFYLEKLENHYEKSDFYNYDYYVLTIEKSGRLATLSFFNEEDLLYITLDNPKNQYRSLSFDNDLERSFTYNAMSELIESENPNIRINFHFIISNCEKLSDYIPVEEKDNIFIYEYVDKTIGPSKIGNTLVSSIKGFGEVIGNGVTSFIDSILIVDGELSVVAVYSLVLIGLSLVGGILFLIIRRFL